MIPKTLMVLLFLLVGSVPASAQERLPIIDMHLHAYGQEWQGSPPNPATGTPAPANAGEHMRQTLDLMDRYNIVTAVVSGPLEAVAAWRAAGQDRILASPLFGRPGFAENGAALPSLDSLAALYASGTLKAMAEVTAQYEGLSPSDPALDPYFALAEKYDVPVGIHTGTSFPRDAVLRQPELPSGVQVWAIDGRSDAAPTLRTTFARSGVHAAQG